MNIEDFRAYCLSFEGVYDMVAASLSKKPGVR